MLQSRVHRQIGSVVLAVAMLFVLTALGHASEWEGTVVEEFHHVYPLTANGRVAIESINGPVHITVWDENQVKVDAVKRAWSKERLDEARIDIDSRSNSLSIRTEYPDHSHNFWNDRHDNPASVEYTLVVPRHARLDEIKLVNGALDVQDVEGDVRASCVNGRLHAMNLGGRTELNTVNGELNASIGHMSGGDLSLSAVNGILRLTLPSDAKANVEASTVSGSISNDFGMTIARHQFVGRSLHGQLGGGGGARVRLSNVNGKIEILRANDGRPQSSVKNLDRDDDGEDDDRI